VAAQVLPRVRRRSVGKQPQPANYETAESCGFYVSGGQSENDQQNSNRAAAPVQPAQPQKTALRLRARQKQPAKTRRAKRATGKSATAATDETDNAVETDTETDSSVDVDNNAVDQEGEHQD